MRWRLAIFDLDGTLSDSMPWFLSVLPEVAARHRFRLAPDPAEREALRALGPREVVRRLGIPRWRLPLIAREMRRRKAAALAAGAIPLFPGVPELLRALSGEGLVLALATSDAEANARRALAAAGLEGLVAHWGCGASLFGKARILRRVLRAARVPPDAAILVGDEVRDAEAARDAGIAFAGVAWGYNLPAALMATRPLALAGTPEDLRRVLLGLDQAPAAWE